MHREDRKSCDCVSLSLAATMKCPGNREVKDLSRISSFLSDKECILFELGFLMIEICVLLSGASWIIYI